MLDAEHWGIGVGDDFYEVTGQDFTTSHMVVVGPDGVVASAPTAPLSEFERKQARAREEYDEVFKLQTDKGEPYTTQWPKDEIKKWIEDWVKEHPKYGVLALQGANCQNFSEDFCCFLTGGLKMPRQHQSRYAAWAAETTSLGHLKSKGGQLFGVGAAQYAGTMAAAQVAEQQAQQSFITKGLVTVGLQSAPAAPATVALAGGAAAAATFNAAIVIKASEFASGKAAEGAAALLGCENEGQQRAYVAGGLAGTLGAGAAIGSAAGPIGAAGGATLAGSVYAVSNLIEYGLDKIKSSRGSSEIEWPPRESPGNLESKDNAAIEVDVEAHYFEQDSAMYQAGIVCVEAARPASWQILSVHVWPYTFCVNVWKKVWVEFQTKDGVWHDSLHCQLPRMHSRRYHAADDESAAVIKIKVTQI